MNRTWYETIVPELDPDLVVVVRSEGENLTLQRPLRTPDGTWIAWNTDEYWRTIETAIDGTIAELRAQGRQVLIIEPFPTTSWQEADPTQCLSDADTIEAVDACAYPNVAPSPSRLEDLYRAHAGRDPGVHVLDLDRLLCPNGVTCPAVIDGVIVRRDWSHLTASFVEANRDVLRQSIVTAGTTNGG